MSAPGTELELARHAAERFARAALAPRAEALDRDPAVAAAALGEAAALGLAALGDGAETGVFAWNGGAPDLALGAALLETVAATSAGFAHLVLVQGLASCAAAALGEESLTAPAALRLPGARLCWAGSLAGRVFVIGGGAGSERERLASGPAPSERAHVLGLREAHPGRLGEGWGAERAIEGGAAEPVTEAIATLAAVGGVAIAAGLARGALTAAERYAGERFQGGALIRDLAVVREMLARAAAQQQSIAALGVSLAAAGDGLAGGAQRARAAFACAADLCVECVTTALQVLGGYGYMADFGLERRFRDAHALRLAIGGARPAAAQGAA